MIHPINHLPPVIRVGIQTEQGVEDIGFDVTPWLTRWPGMTIAVWATRPGENAAYAVANTEMMGNVLYWYPNATDTEKEGAGTVEIVGVSEGKTKSSGPVDTLVKKTTLDVTQETPEPIVPWFQELQKTAGVAQNGAKDAAEAAAAAKQSQENAAEAAGNANAHAQDAKDYAAAADQSVTAAEAYAESASKAAQTAITNADDAENAAKDAQAAVEAANDAKQSAAGFAGSAAAYMETANSAAQSAKESAEQAAAHEEAVISGMQGSDGRGGIFLVTVESDHANRTQAEVKKAVENGMTCILTDDIGHAYTYLTNSDYWDNANEKNCPTFIRYERMENGIAQYEARVLSTGAVAIGYQNGYAKTPNPKMLTIESGSESFKYDGSRNVTVSVPDVFIVKSVERNGGVYADKTRSEIDNALYGGKIVLLQHGVYTAWFSGWEVLDEEECFVFFGGVDVNEKKGIAVSNILVKPSGEILDVFMYEKVPNPYKLRFTGAATAIYDGSGEVTINIPTGGSGVDEETVSKLVEAKVNAILRPVILPETTVEGKGAMPILTPLSGTPEAGMIYAVTYNGTPYDCPARYFEAEDLVGVMLGNTDAVGLPGGNTAAPFTIALVPDGGDLMGDWTIVYGVVADADGATSATISIVGTGRASGNASDVFIVNVTSGDSIHTTADKSYEDTVVAIESGKIVYFKMVSDEGALQSATFAHVREPEKIVVAFHYSDLTAYLHWNADGSFNMTA